MHKEVFAESRASDKEDFDVTMRSFYEVIQRCEDAGNTMEWSHGELSRLHVDSTQQNTPAGSGVIDGDTPPSLSPLIGASFDPRQAPGII